jgi:alpha-D-ribose 1-methylphosphonate 5-triphosphate synthase subunit PhnL
MIEPLIRVRGLAKTFTLHNQGGVELAVLAGLDLDVAPGECVVLDGPSGAGKSTLLKCLYANYRASAGSVRVADTEVTTASPQALLALRRETVGYVSQFLRAVPRVPAIDVVMEPVAGEPDARARGEQLLLRLRIPMRLWRVPPATFSGGEQQRINVARGFIRPMPVLLLDEPTASLDADNRQTVISLIQEARARGSAIVGIFHDQRVRDAVATRICRFH